ncbi:PilN domain-containing protein [Candidatus Woesebacteria bacterium]|nr:PilN domain-containing protein [Candidatus Woesebacteria bacterium]
MKLPAFFGHKRSINLLPRDEFESSTLGIVLEWSLVFGKWAVILTQLVVMGAFLYRFTLDRTLTDLRKSIAKNVAIVKSYDQVERDFVLAQKQVSQAKIALESQDVISKVMNNIIQITPSEVWYDRITISNNTLSLTAYASSLQGFGKFLSGIQSNSLYSGVRVGKIESSATKGAQMQFDVSLTIANASPGKSGGKK